MNIIIEIYILICIFLLLFDVIFLLVQNRKSQATYEINKQFADEIRDELNRYPRRETLSPQFLAGLQSKLAKTRNLLTLQRVMEEFPRQKGLFYESVLAQLDNYKKKHKYEQAYYAYLLSTFDYGNEKPPQEVINSLLSFLDSKSLYVVANTMDALYKIGLIPPLLTALKKADERPGFYHKKLLVEGLLSAQVDKGAFGEQLLSAFNSYTPYMRECLLCYFRMSGYDASDLCLQILKGKVEDTEVVYAAMRYFIKHPNREARNIFLGILENPNASWIRQLLAIQALNHYTDFQVRQTIQKKIPHSNWYVHVNAVEYLYRRGLSKEQVFDILYLNDSCTNELLLYQCRNDKEMTRYIVDTIHLLEAQRSQAKVYSSELPAENYAALRV